MQIKSKIKNFEVVFTDNFKFVDDLKKIDNSVVIVGKNVYSIYKDKIFKKFPKDRIIVLALEEKSKTLDTAVVIYEKLLEKAAKKNLTIISFGGGINQDVVGFVASTLYRGVNWIFIPTTLLAMADSSIGLKTSLNFKSYKNLIGSFYPPSKIIINPDFLKTLPKENYYSGVGEIIKLYLMQKDPIGNLPETIKKIKILTARENKEEILKIIEEAVEIKLSYMEGDEFDQGRRNLLNYGHEFGHALEPASSFKIPHGVAILIGIIFANLISFKRGLINKKIFDEINNLLLIPNVPTDAIPLKLKYFKREELLENIKKDKKRISTDLVLVLPRGKNFSLEKITNLGIDEFNSGLIKLKNFLPLN